MKSHVVKRNHSSLHAGFSLVELLVALSISSILLAITAVSFQGTSDRVGADQAVREVASFVKRARQLAIDRNTRILVEFDEQTHTFVMSKTDAPLSIDPDVLVSLEGLRILYFPDGSSRGAEIAVVANGFQRFVRVASMSGLVSIDE